MTDRSLSVRAATRAEFDLIVDWAAGEGWNPGLHDAEVFYGTDPGGFLMGKIDGEPVGGISVVAYGGGFGFLGFYIVRPEYRGRGYGLDLWRSGMKRLAGRNVGLDGVVEQQPNYRKSGFELAHRNLRYEGPGGGSVAETVGLVELSAVPFAEVLAFDAAMFGRPRPVFLRPWIDQPGAAALGLLRDGRLAGIGVMRPCRAGHKIGPLFADDPGGAETLFVALCARAPGEPVFLDVPQPNAAAVALAERHAMTPVFETARMYTKGDPGVPLARVFGITTFELG